MYALGIDVENGIFRFALVKRSGKDLKIVQTWEGDIKRPLPEGIKPTIVTGLPGTAVIRREFSLKLKREGSILAALPFQTESLIPYPSEETILVPHLHPKGGKATDVVLFATTNRLLHTHLEEMKSHGIDPDLVSTKGVALVRWAEWAHPELKVVCVMKHGCCGLISDGKISLLQPYENELRMRAVIEAKYRDVPILVPEDPHAIGIGLALDGLQKNRIQFRRDDFPSQKIKKRRARSRLQYLTASFALACLILGIGIHHLEKQERRLKTEISTTCRLPMEEGKIEQMISTWRVDVDQQLNQIPLMPTTPSVSDVLAWLSSKSQEIEIIHVHYQFIQYPKLDRLKDPYRVKLDLEFKAPSPGVAREFISSISEGQKEATLDTLEKFYKTTIYLS